MRELVSNQMIAQKMQAKIAGDVAVTPTEVYEFYKSIPEDSLPLINSEVEWAQIVRYPKVRAESKQEAIARLEELRQRVAKGSNFATLAILYSEDPGSAKNGGEYRGIKRGQFVKEFEAVAFNLAKGEVSEPFETEFGFHIVQLLEKKGDELDLRHILIKPKISDSDLNKARDGLDSLRAQIALGSLSFDQAAADFSEDENTRYNNGLMMNPQSGDSKWELNQLDRSVFYAIDALKPGEVSKPGLLRNPDGKEGFRLIKVLTRTQPHRANIKEDYARLQMIAENRKRSESIDRWIEERLAETSVRIRAEWVDCAFDNSWGLAREQQKTQP
jgi:peptidyl-prolyl cis-trans isomerase SurA